MAYPLTEMSTDDIIKILRHYDSMDATPGARKAWDEFTIGDADNEGLFDEGTVWEDFPKTILVASVREGEAIFGEVGEETINGEEVVEDVDGSFEGSTDELLEVDDDEIIEVGAGDEIIEVEDIQDELLLSDEDIEDIEITEESNEEDDDDDDVNLEGIADEEEITVCDVDSEEMAKGIIIEMEHTEDPKIALDIVLDHLTEIDDYYTRLEDMEEDAEEGVVEETLTEIYISDWENFERVSDESITFDDDNLDNIISEIFQAYHNNEIDDKFITDKMSSLNSIQLEAKSIVNYIDRLKTAFGAIEVAHEESTKLINESKGYNFGEEPVRKTKLITESVTNALSTLNQKELIKLKSKMVEEAVDLDEGDLKDLWIQLEELKTLNKDFYNKFEDIIGEFVDEDEVEAEIALTKADDDDIVDLPLDTDSDIDDVKEVIDEEDYDEVKEEGLKKKLKGTSAKDIITKVLEEEMDKDGNIDNFDLSNHFSVEFVQNWRDSEKDDSVYKQKYDIIIADKDYVVIVDVEGQKVKWVGDKPKHHEHIGKELLFGDLYSTVGQS